MPHWTSFKTSAEVRQYFLDLGRQIRTGSPDLGRINYSMNLALGVWQAIVCGYDHIAAVEVGVARGGGLLDLCKAAEYFAEETGIRIDVYGFDNATGLPPTLDYRDHPELWAQGQFKMQDADELRAKLPPFAKLIIGDVKDTIRDLEGMLGGARLAFVSIDVDYYSSTVPTMEIFKFNRDAYVPALPVYFDDVLKLISYNDWCGEALAIREFNDANTMRKVQQHDGRKLYIAHILDHKVRTGEEKLRPRFTLHVTPI
jgi:hypothetical protein